ncbi:MAG: hypothetical protein KatS3mg109_1317 [Pirellulaceae bacterium]|nr:MAG: hypothetical protein KatS3mg109_1317 [Pirellulaceae bacterium]
MYPQLAEAFDAARAAGRELVVFHHIGVLLKEFGK